MNKKELLEKFLNDFVESGTSAVLNKVAEYLREKNNLEENDYSLFLKKIALVYINPNILSGGGTIKEDFKRFVRYGLKIKVKGKNATFEDENIAMLKKDEMLYILGSGVRELKYKEKVEVKKINNRKSNRKDNKRIKNYTSKGYDSANNPFKDLLKDFY